jgi:hypothetical protein
MGRTFGTSEYFMIAIGQIRKIRSSNSAFAFLLDVNRDENFVLIALVSKQATLNFSKIALSSTLFLYPAIQASISKYSLGDLVPYETKFEEKALVDIAMKWIGLSEVRKIEFASGFPETVILGDSQQETLEGFVSDYQIFHSISHRFHNSQSLGAQYGSSALQKLEQEHTSKLTMLEASSAALYSESSAVGVIQGLGGTELSGSDPFRNVLLRRAARLRTSRSPQSPSARNRQLEFLFDFMNEYGVNPLPYFIGTNEDAFQTGVRRRGDLALIIKQV